MRKEFARRKKHLTHRELNAAGPSPMERLEDRKLLSVAVANGTSNAMAYDASGKLFLAYYDASSHTLKYSIRSTNGTWSAPDTIDDGNVTTPHSANVGQYVTMATDSTGTPAVAYTDGTNADLKFARWNGSTGTWTVTGPIDGATSSVGLYPSLAYNGNNAAIAYYAQGSQRLRFVQQSGGTWGAPVVVDATSADVGRYPSLALVGGKWAIAYDDSINTSLKYVIQSTGSNWGTPVAIDTNTQGDVAYIDMVVDSGGNPGVSYYDTYDSALKYTHRNSNGSWPAAVTPTRAGRVGLYSTLFYNGTTPTIYFQDATNNTINAATPALVGWSNTPFFKGGGPEAHAVKSAAGVMSFSWNGPDVLVAGQNDVFVSDYSVGSNWSNTTPTGTSWSGRYYMGTTVANGKMWITGGYGNGLLGDVWSSSDGANWTQTASAAAFGSRYGHGMVTDGSGTMYVIGGRATQTSGPAATVSDVWSSTDGITWTQLTANAGFAGREHATVIYFNNKIWVIGGNNGYSGALSDVWSSPDGVTWTQETSSGAFGAIRNAAGNVFGGKMWVTGGLNGSGVAQNGVWSSTDGVTWTQSAGAGVTGSNPFSARTDHALVTFDNRMWILGGNNLTFLNDAWWSVDGVNWNATPGAYVFGQFFTLGRSAFGTAVFNGKMWAIGGSEGGYTGDSDLYSAS